MRLARQILLAFAVLGTLSACQPSAPTRAPTRADGPAVVYGSVVSVNPIATDAGMDALRSGGNAVDAAVATMLTLGVVDGHNSGIGGGCFMLIRLADGRVFALDGRETAPAAASRDMYVRNGKADTTLSQTGALAVGVPGSLAAYDHALRHFGKRTLADAITPAGDLAERGFAIDASYAEKIRATAADLARFDTAKRLLFTPDGNPLAAGATLRQPDLAATYRAIASDGIRHFYRGEFARAVGAWMRDNGGILTADDFAGYEAKRRDPIRSTYHGREIIGFPPPSSGGVHVAQILTMLERFELAQMDEPTRLTTIANAMKLAFADRAFWLGDPDAVAVPRGLLDRAYLDAQSRRVATDRAITVAAHGTPPRADEDLFRRLEAKHTTHVSVADAAGNVVSVTATVNTSFGSKVIVPGTGVFLNNQMDDFSVEPGVPNYFGLVGAKRNAIAPGKRPLSSMSPTIVLRDGVPEIVAGAAGGPKIITQVVCVLSNLIDLKLDAKAAMTRPRIHHQWRPDRLWMENTVAPPTRQALSERGFELDVAAPVGATNLIVIDRGTMTPVSEPRLTGKGAAE